jgi:monoamine oxidase
MTKKIVILRFAGLSGLLTAYRLHNKGFDIEIIEARDSLADASILSILMRAKSKWATWFNDIHVISGIY